MSITVTHDGTVTNAIAPYKVGDEVGKIYLNDIGKRHAFGGGASIHEKGQDQYLAPAGSVVLEETSDVLLSLDRGLIKRMVDLGVFSIT